MSRTCVASRRVADAREVVDDVCGRAIDRSNDRVGGDAKSLVARRRRFALFLANNNGYVMVGVPPRGGTLIFVRVVIVVAVVVVVVAKWRVERFGGDEENVVGETEFDVVSKPLGLFGGEED